MHKLPAMLPPSHLLEVINVQLAYEGRDTPMGEVAGQNNVTERVQLPVSESVTTRAQQWVT
jgi:hypothetical protein